MKHFLMHQGIDEPSQQQIFNAVIQVRQLRLPDTKTLGSCGSFFKNPVLTQEEGDRLRKRVSDVPLFPGREGRVKVSAAWLIDRLGWRGVEKQGVKVSEAHALVLVGCGAQTAAPWLSLAADIIASVEGAFGLTLEMEPRVLGRPEGVAS